MSELKKAVLITGANSGIGKELSQIFLANGHNVIGMARRIDLLNKSKEEFGAIGENFYPIKLDIRNYEDVKAFSDEIKSNYFINCIINNAGVTSFKKSSENTIDDIEEIIQTNLLGSIFIIKSFLEEMISKKSGTIINILSVVTKKIFTSSSAYSAAKAGLQSYTNVLREEVRNENIRVINVSPGATATPIWPDKALEKHASKMMKAKDVAAIIYNAFAEKSNLVIEDIVIRPVSGDL